MRPGPRASMNPHELDNEALALKPVFWFHACKDLPQPSKQGGKSIKITENSTVLGFQGSL